jgi:hypothetical protein
MELLSLVSFGKKSLVPIGSRVKTPKVVAVLTSPLTMLVNCRAHPVAVVGTVTVAVKLNASMTNVLLTAVGLFSSSVLVHRTLQEWTPSLSFSSIVMVAPGELVKPLITDVLLTRQTLDGIDIFQAILLPDLLGMRSS